MKTRLIETDGRDLRCCIGESAESNALAVNPAASAQLLYSAAESYVADIRALTAPIGYLPDDAADCIPATVYRSFIDAISNLARLADSILEHAGALEYSRGQAASKRSTKGA